MVLVVVRTNKTHYPLPILEDDVAVLVSHCNRSPVILSGDETGLFSLVKKRKREKEEKEKEENRNKG